MAGGRRWLIRLFCPPDGFNGVGGERLSVLAKAKSFEPLRDIVRHGGLLRQASFAQIIGH
jgi:hypothetical protein